MIVPSGIAKVIVSDCTKGRILAGASSSSLPPQQAVKASKTEDHTRVVKALVLLIFLSEILEELSEEFKPFNVAIFL